MAIRANIELDAGTKTFATGLLIELIAALRRIRPGDLMAVIGSDRTVGTELEAWCRFARNSLVEVTVEEARYRWVIRCGEAPAEADGEATTEAHRPLGTRLWLYTNFDCNLRCDYCCVRSSPKTPRRALGAERVCRIAREATALGVGEIFVTGGEPFLLGDIGDILVRTRSCASPGDKSSTARNARRRSAVYSAADFAAAFAKNPWRTQASRKATYPSRCGSSQ
jgi:TusA-related sulfurtransferase